MPNDTAWTPIERKVASIWQEVLKLAPTGRDDSFLVLGGDSVMAMLVLSRIERAFGVRVPEYAFFADPTVSGLARATEELLVDSIGALSDEEAERLARSDEAG